MTKDKKEPEQVPQQVNIRVKDGDQFYANETSINFGPVEFSIDFKCISHLQDIANHNAMMLRHNIVILTPFHAKSFLEVLQRSVKEYEDKFGTIKKPAELDKAEKIFKKEQNKILKEEKLENTSNTYFG